MAGSTEAERTTSSSHTATCYLSVTIEFIHTKQWKSKTLLIEKYVEKRLSIAQIAEEIASSKSTIRSALKRFKIPIREKGNPGFRPAQVPFGYRRERGLLAPYLEEQKIIEAIMKMADGGVSYRKICEFLSTMKVPTKMRGRKWHPEMIRRILKR